MGGLLGQRDLLLALAIGLVLLCLMFLPEGRAAVEVWNASTAYSHCYLILPMTLYLLRERWAVLRTIGATPEPIVALAAIPIAMAWLVAERLGFMEGRQLAAIASVELFLCAVLGRRLFWQLSGPLLFLFFLVPFGAFLTPVLQRFTAAFSIIGLNLLGIPNFSDGFTIETPSGVFFVAEACAGLRFLIAAIAFGVFYALLNYTSPTRRACFMAASIVVPIIANGIRALGIIVLGQILGSAEAAAADHIIYGWLFFTIVMLLLIAGGQIFREQTATVYQPSALNSTCREEGSASDSAVQCGTLKPRAGRCVVDRCPGGRSGVLSGVLIRRADQMHDHRQVRTDQSLGDNDDLRRDTFRVAREPLCTAVDLKCDGRRAASGDAGDQCRRRCHRYGRCSGQCWALDYCADYRP